MTSFLASNSKQRIWFGIVLQFKIVRTVYMEDEGMKCLELWNIANLYKLHVVASDELLYGASHVTVLLEDDHGKRKCRIIAI